MSARPASHPRRELALLTCMDCRIDPLAALGIELGEAHVIRNAGAIVTEDAIRSLALSQRALGTREIWVVMHTACGVLGLDDDAFLDRIESETGERPRWTPGGFDSFEAELARGIGRLRAAPELDTESVRGLLLDIETGELGEPVSY